MQQAEHSSYCSPEAKGRNDIDIPVESAEFAGNGNEKTVELKGRIVSEVGGWSLSMLSVLKNATKTGSHCSTA